MKPNLYHSIGDPGFNPRFFDCIRSQELKQRLPEFSENDLAAVMSGNGKNFAIV